MIENCRTCGIESNYLEVHHIIPRSRGGSNNANNLIKICTDCHVKAHDVKFRGENGLIKEGQKKSELKDEFAKNWLIENQDIVDKFLEDLLNNDIEKIHVFNYVMCEAFSWKKNAFLYDLINFGQSKINFTFKL